MKKKKSLTAAELMEKLNADPEFTAKRRLADQERDARVVEWRHAEAPLVSELEQAGFDVGTVWDLVNTSEPYSEVLPILIKHLQLPYPGRVREGIARALGVPQAKFAWDLLTRLYRYEEEKDAKHGLAAALGAIADKDVVEDLIALARDTTNGSSRLLLLGALERCNDPHAREALIELRNDAQLKREVQAVLRRLKLSP